MFIHNLRQCLDECAFMSSYDVDGSSDIYRQGSAGQAARADVVVVLADAARRVRRLEALETVAADALRRRARDTTTAVAVAHAEG
ncbi:hypothetical protein NPX13_g7160 [Xylaria arbuscula]|uniref:Uncharacterized protein n=1 Tax=Xylaria arbuscula TaxID=114810 RepID=A0A9W8NAI1_9PEZI|nr:hypothetical protein NPX13_g7160 [Xylaria arbuscula]